MAINNKQERFLLGNTYSYRASTQEGTSSCVGDIKKSFREETDKLACVYMKWADPRLNFFLN